jgi:hypothetical protein
MTKESERLPSNPKLAEGVRMLFLGTGRRELLGPESGLKYFVSENRRHFTVHSDDAAKLLKGFVIREP